MTKWPMLGLVALVLTLSSCTNAPSSPTISSPPAPSTTPTGLATTASSPYVHVLADPDSFITFTGIGRMTIDTPVADLAAAGLIVQNNSECGDAWAANQTLANKGVSVITGENRLWEVKVTSDLYPTKDGARVGMTFAEARAIYGSRFTIETKIYDTRDIQAGVVSDNGYELVFLKPLDGTDLDDSSTIDSIQARKSSKEMHTGC